MSIPGPLLFLIFINDIINDIKANIRLFADDTSLYIIVEDSVASAAVLNHDLSQISSWSKKWLVTFNPSKTESVIFSRKHQKQHHPSLYLDNVPISQVSTHTHLGVTFTTDGKCQSHISLNINKAWQRIGILRTLTFVVSRSALDKMYITFIRPLLEYADIVWDNCSIELKNGIEAVQHEAARIVTGATKLCSIYRLMERRRKHRLILFFKMKDGISPE